MFKKVDANVNFPKMEEAILQFWDAEKIFEKSIRQREGKAGYSFYDGPPFATGTPHYGHIVASAIKDTVPRYFTMKGFQVERKWGWDCHGLPIENIAEKELGITHKKEIVALGVEKFNEICRSKVLEYVAEWKKVIRRFGRFADMENAYKTMDLDYMESIWWVFKELWDKGLIYESYRTMHICPRCETTLSQSEVAEGYKDVKDLAVTAKFELVDEPGTFVLAWTTTPWTLPGNVALAVGKSIRYQVVRIKGEKEKYIVAEDRAEGLFKDREYEIIEEFKGEELVGKSYKPLFDYYTQDKKLENRENGWKIYHADFVTTEVGTGIAHEAPAFGEEDMELGKKEKLPFVQHVKMDGTMKDEVTDFAGMSVKPKENPQAMDVEIIKYLAHTGLLFVKEKYEHSYPHCWRCDTPLLNYATSSWFVSVTKVKGRALELAESIHWSPEHIKVGRFGKWLEGARDWSISRQRYWASVMPLWKCDCGEMKVFGSVAELEKASGKKVADLHKHIVDEITFPCEKCGEMMKRIPDVLDTWFDSGSMPYAQAHYPFADKEKFEKSFPAQFIAEGIDQTRAWFYYLHIIATSIKDKGAFQNVVVNGIVLAEDGKKMSKKLQNYPDPMTILDKYGADVLRFYLLSSPVVAAENLNFSERDLNDVSRNVFRMLWNSYSFFTTYASIDNWEPKKGAKPSESILDKWILSELQLLIQEVESAMEKYELSKATRLFTPFIDNLSNWYIRRSRKRFWKSEDDNDKENAYQTLYDVLVTLVKVMAPFTPFLSEEIFKNLAEEESVHLADWPIVKKELIDEKLNEEMRTARDLVTEGLKLRSDAKIKVRQPLGVSGIRYQVSGEMQEILKEELNVKNIVVDEKQIGNITLNTEITEELKLEGAAREIIRAIQEGRKKAKFNVEDRVILGYQGKENVFAKFENEIAKEVLATSVQRGNLADAEYNETVELDGEQFSFSLKRV
ncbi:MAG: isoleucine--tRNA ligase [Candidatus Moranbacteria bacterium]|nr:isoleucine--tRNA ligase [Candidatus Moranbacteria bacterium]